MKQIISLVALSISFFTVQSQSLIGAWEALGSVGENEIRSVVILTDKYQVGTFYDAKTGAFIGTGTRRKYHF